MPGKENRNKNKKANNNSNNFEYLGAKSRVLELRTSHINHSIDRLIYFGTVNGIFLA